MYVLTLTLTLTLTLHPHRHVCRLAMPRLALSRLASPRLASPRLASPRLASPRLASPREGKKEGKGPCDRQVRVAVWSLRKEVTYPRVVTGKATLTCLSRFAFGFWFQNPFFSVSFSLLFFIFVFFFCCRV